jgi:hypothetical protein
MPCYQRNIPISGSSGYWLVAEQTGSPYHEDVCPFELNCGVDTSRSAVLSSATALEPSISAGENMPLADNFLQKQQKQRERGFREGLRFGQAATLRGKSRRARPIFAPLSS